jgi:dTDP-4-amino-4,6-dideoxygalactose transaminase
MPKLAIAGGHPVRSAGVPPWPVFDERERQALAQVLESRNWGGYPFPNLHARRFAEDFAREHGADYGIAVANGTVTLETALKALGIGPGDEVIVPAYTFEATAVPVLKLQAVPVFVDVLPDTYCIDPRAAEEAVTERTRAMIPVHLGMNMADMDELRSLAVRSSLKILEDAAHAHGARWKGRGAGSLGDAGSFSMQTTKLMTAGEGGIITTCDDEVFERCQSYVNCGRASETDRHGHQVLGFNYRMTEFQAAVLRVQLERLVSQTEHRENTAARLSQGLSDIPGISTLRRDERITRRAIYQYIFKYDPEAFDGIPRNRFVAALEAEGVPCEGLFYEPVYRSSLFHVDPADHPWLTLGRDGRLPWADTHCPVAERAAYEESVWIPHWVLLGTAAEMDEIVEAVEKIRGGLDELRKAEHPLIRIKSQGRANRDRFEKRIRDSVLAE